jgi:hypothetical protein
VKAIIALLLFAATFSCAKEQPPAAKPAASSTIGSSAPKVDLQISEQMRQALDRFAPTFAPFDADEYSREVLADSSTWQTSRPYEARADLNGDGLQDVVLNGHDNARELLIVLLSQPDSTFKVYPLKEIGRQPTYKHDVQIVLTTVNPGPVAAEGPVVPAALPFGGIEVHYPGASEIFYWNGSRFLQFFTGD